MSGSFTNSPARPAASIPLRRLHRPAFSAMSRPRPSSSRPAASPLKLVFGAQEFPLRDSLILIGRHPDCTIPLLKDLQVSGRHAQIKNGFVSDMKSTNGTLVNDKLLRAADKPILLRRGDTIQCGESVFRIEAGEAKPRENQELSRSKKFAAGEVQLNRQLQPANEKSKAEDKSASSSQFVEALMETEFSSIIGHDSIKAQLRQFHKKVQLDRIRVLAGKDKDVKRLYHMIFSGPPGTGQLSRQASSRTRSRGRSFAHLALSTPCDRKNDDGEFGGQVATRDEIGRELECGFR